MAPMGAMGPIAFGPQGTAGTGECLGVDDVAWECAIEPRLTSFCPPSLTGQNHLQEQSESLRIIGRGSQNQAEVPLEPRAQPGEAARVAAWLAGCRSGWLTGWLAGCVRHNYMLPGSSTAKSWHGIHLLSCHVISHHGNSSHVSCYWI